MNRRRLFSAILLGFTAPLLSFGASAEEQAATPTQTPPRPTPEAAIREAGRQWLLANDGVGLTIGVYDSGRRGYYNFGVTQLDGNRIPDEHTVYEIGQLSRLFTGQILARALVEGRARLEDDISQHLAEPYPNLENGGERVRLLHLVSSTSQLADNIPDRTQVLPAPGESLAIAHMRVLQRYTAGEFLQQLHRVVPRFKPGSEPRESNVGAMLVGVALENIYGEPFPLILAREIERPLRMESGVSPPARRLAVGYTAANEALPPFDAVTQYPSMGLRYSAQDLLTFAAWQLAERDASSKLAHRPTWTLPDGRQGVGIFWIVMDSPRGRRLWYAGATFGFASLVELYPDEKLAVVLLSNKFADGAQESLRALSAEIVGLLRPERR